MFDLIVFGFTFASILAPCLFDFHFGGAAPPLCPLVCQGHVVLALSLYLWKFQRFVRSIRTVLLHPLCQISLVCQLPCKQTASPKQKANGKQSNRRLVPYSQIGTWVCSRLGGHIINCFLSQICCKSGPFAFYRRWPPINGYFSAWKIGKINQIK